MLFKRAFCVIVMALVVIASLALFAVIQGRWIRSQRIVYTTSKTRELTKTPRNQGELAIRNYSLKAKWAGEVPDGRVRPEFQAHLFIFGSPRAAALRWGRICPNGTRHISPGQRPGDSTPPIPAF